MSKRFMDTDLWDQSWYVELSSESKNIWAYLERKSDSAGILKVEIPEMKRKIGCTEISIAKFLSEVNRDFDGESGKVIERNRVMYISNNTKLWMTGFISFQYEKGKGGVNAGIPAIKGALNRLRDEGLYDYAIKEGFVRVKGEIDGKTIGEEESEVREGISSDVKIIPNSSDLIDSSENNSKGCRGSARDKDKDKDEDQEVLKFQEINTEEEGGNVHVHGKSEGLEEDLKVEETNTEEEKGNVHKEVKGAEELFKFQETNTEEKKGNIPTEAKGADELLGKIWSRGNSLPEEERIVKGYINKYGFNAVEFAFREGVKYNKMSLAYVDAICRKRKEKADMVEYRNRDKMKLHEAILKAEEQRRSGKCLTLVREVYG